MSKLFVKDIISGTKVDTVFLVKEKTLATAKNGKPYLSLKLMDKTGEVDAKVWDNADVLFQRFEKDDFVVVSGKSDTYKDKIQLVLTEIARIPDGEVDLSSFLPQSPRDIEVMKKELLDLVASVKNADLKRLLESYFHDSEFMAKFASAPAASGMHHVYVGGLLEHTVSVGKLVDLVIGQYPAADRDLTIAGALFHDIGKVRELAYARSFDYEDEGRLVGHIVIGSEMLHDRMASLGGFSTEMEMVLKHLVLSHHGLLEYGSPKRPKTIEAVVLNYVDELDSKANGVLLHMEKESNMQTGWTSYHRRYERYFYVGCPDTPEVVRVAE